MIKAYMYELRNRILVLLAGKSSIIINADMELNSVLMSPDNNFIHNCDIRFENFTRPQGIQWKAE